MLSGIGNLEIEGTCEQVRGTKKLANFLAERYLIASNSS